MQGRLCGVQDCSLCEDELLRRTGVCISCDAGMCRSYFHVTWQVTGDCCLDFDTRQFGKAQRCYSEEVSAVCSS